MDIHERTPVIYVPNHVKEQMLEGHKLWSSVLQYNGSDRTIIQKMLNLAGDTTGGSLAAILEVLLIGGDGIELGLVSSWNDEFVFVKYHPSLHRTGWDITSQATSREDLFERSYVVEDEAFIQERTPGVQEEANA